VGSVRYSEPVHILLSLGLRAQLGGAREIYRRVTSFLTDCVTRHITAIHFRYSTKKTTSSMACVKFGLDGIRGIAGEWPLEPAVVVSIGQALGQFVSRLSAHPSVVVGRDTRSSGVWIVSNLVAGLTAHQVDVIDLGVMSTPGVAFLARRQNAALGIVVSASHNLSHYNGIKLVGPDGLRLVVEDEMTIEYLIQQCLQNQPNAIARLGSWIRGDHLVDFYIEDHIRFIKSQSAASQVFPLAGMALLLDCANGATSVIAPAVFKSLGATVTVIGTHGSGINHRGGTEYARENPRSLIDRLHECGARYAFAFDGDGDRLIVAQSNGDLFDGDDLLFFLARHFMALGKLRHNVVVSTEIANRGLERSLARYGIQVEYAGKGDRSLEHSIWSRNYLLGGEPGGNIIINDGHHTSADAVFTALIIASALNCGTTTDLSDIRSSFVKCHQIVRAIPMVVGLDFSTPLVHRIRDFEAQLGEGGRIKWWQSSTEPDIIRVLVEGGATCPMSQVQQVLRDVIEFLAHRPVAHS
jgi:phosphoglucosamine mutase